MVNGNWRWLASTPVLALVPLSALAVWPLLRAGYPAIGDGLNHFYRLVEFKHLLQHGVWFPRWATDLAYGYGYPLFNYYPPLTYYLGALFSGAGLNSANSLLAVYIAGWLLAMSGAYCLARERGGAAAGLVAAAAYGLAPYLYFNALARGALPETLGLGLLPWALWACYRLTLQPNRGLVILSALLYAALLLTHLLTALLALPLIALFWWLAWRTRPPAPSITNYQLPITLLLGFGLAAYFFLPALLETHAVQIGQLTGPSDLDYHNNFLAIGELLALPRAFDARLVFRDVPPSLNLAALVLAGFGLARRAWQARRGDSALDAWDGGLWLGMAVLSLFTLRLSQPAWERLPGAGLVQFPWRLVGPASLLLALLAARAVDTPGVGTSRKHGPAPKGRFAKSGHSPPPADRRPRLGTPLQLAGPPLALAGLFFFSLTWTFAAGPPAPAAGSVRDLAGYERSSGQLGTTSAAEFLPLAVARLPDPRSLEAAYALHSVIERLGPPPPGVTVESQEASVISAGAVVTAQAPALLTFDLFDFPGWRATVDEQPAPITASQPNGLIMVSVPAGRHAVQVAFGSTPLRTTATALSFMAAGLLALIASGRIRVDLPILHSLTHTATYPSRSSPVGHTPMLPLALTALVLLTLRFMAIDGRDTPFARSRFDGERVAGAGQAFDANFEDQLVLIGLDLPESRVAADSALPLTLYWRAQNVPGVDYATTVQLLDDQGNQWGQSDSQNPGALPTSRWGLGQYARDAHLLRLRPGTPPGRYSLVAGVYQVGGAALSVLDANRVPQGQTQQLGLLTVTRAQKPPATIGAARPANIPFGPLTYLGGSMSNDSPQAGDELTLELFWRAEGATRPDVTMHLALVGADGSPIQAWDVPPGRADYLTGEWSAGEIVRSVQRLRVPAQAPAGPASLQLSLSNVPGIAKPAPIASLNLRVPARSFAAPPMAHVINTMLGQPVKLLGYDLDPDGVTLYWQAVAGMDTSYSVFVHALDAAGAIVSQVDAPPLNGNRPTTGWLPGEVLADHYTVSPGDAKSLEVGLYDPTTRRRLGTINIPLQP
jgi:hypothetical protein